MTYLIQRFIVLWAQLSSFPQLRWCMCSLYRLRVQLKRACFTFSRTEHLTTYRHTVFLFYGSVLTISEWAWAPVAHSSQVIPVPAERRCVRRHLVTAVAAVYYLSRKLCVVRAASESHTCQTTSSLCIVREDLSSQNEPAREWNRCRVASCARQLRLKLAGGGGRLFFTLGRASKCDILCRNRSKYLIITCTKYASLWVFEELLS